MSKKSKKSMSLSEVMESVSYLKNLGVKYHNYVTGKTNNQITFNELLSDYVNADKKFNNGKSIKKIQRKISKILNNLF